MNKIDVHNLEDSPLGVGIRRRAVISQPIHETLKPRTKPERFDLTWEMIERLTSERITVTERKLALLVYDMSDKLISNKIAETLATALEIILQCRTFSPGVFKRDGSGRWRREGEHHSHNSTEGC